MTLVQTIITSLVTSSAIIGLAAFVGRLILGGVTSHFFNRRIAAYKHQLTSISDQMKFEYERRATDFSLYIKIKHETYSKLYELLSVADGRLMSLRGFRNELSFEEFNVEDIAKHLRSHHVVEGKVAEITAVWNRNKDEGIQQAQEYLKMIELQTSDKARNDAKNYLIVNALYISEEVEARIQALLSKMVELQVSVEFSPGPGTGLKEWYERDKAAIKEKETILARIKSQMRSELSLGASGYTTAHGSDVAST